jgi:hypothetical protein
MAEEIEGELQVESPPDKLKLLHEALAADEVFSQVVDRDFGKFQKDYSDPKKIKTLYDALKADEVFSQAVPKTFELAVSEFGLGKPRPASKPSVGAGSQLPIGGVSKKVTSPLVGGEVAQPIDGETDFGFGGVVDVVTDPKIAKERTAAYNYETKQKYHKDVQESYLNVFDPSSPDRLGPIQQGKQDAARNLARAQVDANTALSEITPLINEKVSSAMNEPTVGKEGSYEDFVASTKLGNKMVNTVKLGEFADKQIQELGLPDSKYVRDLIYNKAEQEVQFQMNKTAAEKIYHQSPEFIALSKKQADANYKVDEINKETINAEGQIKTLSKTISAEKSVVLSDVNKANEELSKSIEANYLAQQAEVKGKIDAINQAYSEGRFQSYDQYVAAFNQSKEEYDQLGKGFEEAFNQQQEEYINKFNEVSTKYNQRFIRQRDEVIQMANQKIAPLAAELKKQGVSEENIKAIKKAYGDAFEKVAGKNGLNNQFLEDIESTLGGPIPYIFSTMSALGGAMKGYGESLNMPGLKDFGAYMEKDYSLTEAKTDNFSDYLDPKNAQKLLGQFTGGMLPSMGAAIAVSRFAPGVAGKMIAGSFASWFSESIDMAGRASLDAFAKTGSAAEANRQYNATMDYQKKTMILHSGDMIPFVGNILKFIKPAALKVGVGAGLSLVEELTQEYGQNVADRAIKGNINPFGEIGHSLQGVLGISGNKDFDAFAKKELKTTTINILPSLGMGGVGQVRAISEEKDQKAKVEAAANKLAADISVVNLTPDATPQFLTRITLAQGKAFTVSMIGGLFASGKIDAVKRDEMLKQADESQDVVDFGKRNGMDNDQTRVFSSMKSKYTLSQQAADAETDPILKEVAQKNADALKQRMTSYADSRKGDFIITETPNGTQFINTESEMQSMIANPDFKAAFIKGLIKVDFHGNIKAQADLVDALKQMPLEAAYQANAKAEAAAAEAAPTPESPMFEIGSEGKTEVVDLTPKAAEGATPTPASRTPSENFTTVTDEDVISAAQEFGMPVADKVDAERAYSNGDAVFVTNEQDGELIQVENVTAKTVEGYPTSDIIIVKAVDMPPSAQPQAAKEGVTTPQMQGETKTTQNESTKQGGTTTPPTSERVTGDQGKTESATQGDAQNATQGDAQNAEAANRQAGVPSQENELAPTAPTSQSVSIFQELDKVPSQSKGKRAKAERAKFDKKHGEKAKQAKDINANFEAYEKKLMDEGVILKKKC